MIETLDELSEKAASLASRIAAEKGGLSLLALFHREGAPDRWDLLVAAPWLETEKRRGLEYLARELQQTFESHDLLRLSRIVILVESDPIRRELRRLAQTEGEPVVLRGLTVGGLGIDEAIFFISR